MSLDDVGEFYDPRGRNFVNLDVGKVEVDFEFVPFKCEFKRFVKV